ncbi:MAG: invasion associated locus B family protein [Hyphomicrobiaceae bacterium]
MARSVAQRFRKYREIRSLMLARRKIFAAAVCTIAVAAGLTLASSAVTAQSVKTIGTYSSWTSFTHGEAPGLLCFATAQPAKQEPANVKRDPAFVYVSSWPKDGVKAEISVKIGYALRKGSDVTLAIGSSNFKLFVNGDRAYVADATEELKLLDAMRKGSTMTVQGTSERGTSTTDTYSLSGITQALQAVATSCK